MISKQFYPNIFESINENSICRFLTFDSLLCITKINLLCSFGGCGGGGGGNSCSGGGGGCISFR